MPFFFSLFLFYHAFIVSRYKKLRTALAMERTKPINQNKQQKKPSSWSTAFTESTWAKTVCPSFPMKTKYKEITTLNYFSFRGFLQGKIYKGRLKHPVNHNVGGRKKEPLGGTMCFFTLG